MTIHYLVYTEYQKQQNRT